MKQKIDKLTVLSVICDSGTLNNPITAKQIAISMGVYDKKDTTSLHIRNAISSLVEGGFPIGSNAYGFFWMDSDEAYASAVGWLENKTAGNIKRISLLKKAYQNVRSGRIKF